MILHQHEYEFITEVFGHDRWIVTDIENGRRFFIEDDDNEYVIRTWNHTKNFIEYTLYKVVNDESTEVKKGRYDFEYTPYTKDELIEMLMDELDDALDFMEGFEDVPENFGDMGMTRLNNKKSLLRVAAYQLFSRNKRQ